MTQESSDPGASSGTVPGDSMRMLTEDEVLRAIQSCGSELHGRIALTFESGPYDIDRPTLVADRLATAIQRKFMEVNAIAAMLGADTEGSGQMK